MFCIVKRGCGNIKGNDMMVYVKIVKICEDMKPIPHYDTQSLWWPMINCDTKLIASAIVSSINTSIFSYVNMYLVVIDDFFTMT